MSYVANAIVLSLCVLFPHVTDFWHEGYCKVEFLCYRGEPNWLGYVVFYAIFGLLYWFFGFWKGPRKNHIDDDRK